MTKAELIRGLGAIKTACQQHSVYSVSIDGEPVSIYDIFIECMKTIAEVEDDLLYIPRDEFGLHCELNKYYWVEIKYNGVYYLQLIYGTHTTDSGRIFTFDVPFHKPSFVMEHYNKTWRVWDHEPTPAERGAEKWDD